MANSQPFDVAIIGGGIAGLSVALRLPEYVRIALFTKGHLGESNTRYAQGGLAVALGADDSPELHLQDTLAAGAGLCDEQAVRILVEQAPEAVRWLIHLGVQFDCAQPGSDEHITSEGLLLGREGAHSRWRVLHAGGDATGAEIERALIFALRKRSSIVVYENTRVSQLLMHNGICTGLQAMCSDGSRFTLEARATVLANGGAGGLWLHTSNPAGATADGIALAWKAGAAVSDLEFMQFHPTVLVAHGRSHLISEAVRGEGAYLRNHAGERFMPRYSAQAELAPRDVVARAILCEMLAERTEYQYLDLRHLPADKMHRRFPTISTFCRQQGLDLATDLLPVAPAAHYCMGGVLVDHQGRTTVPGLYAVGEVACTGVHGANRLASNSLLEGLVFGIRVADELVKKCVPSTQFSLQRNATFIRYDALPRTDIPSSSSSDEQTTRQVQQELRQIMWHSVSLRRDQIGLLEAQQKIRTFYRRVIASQVRMSDSSLGLETENMLLVADLVIAAALVRRESRGSHWRSDYPCVDTALDGHHYVFRGYEGSSSYAEQSQTEVAAHV